jgi:hypothetical protein
MDHLESADPQPCVSVGNEDGLISLFGSTELGAGQEIRSIRGTISSVVAMEAHGFGII